jgi:hypothetical protein
MGAIFTPLAGASFGAMYSATAGTFIGIHVGTGNDLLTN